METAFVTVVLHSGLNRCIIHNRTTADACVLEDVLYDGHDMDMDNAREFRIAKRSVAKMCRDFLKNGLPEG